MSEYRVPFRVDFHPDAGARSRYGWGVARQDGWSQAGTRDIILISLAGTGSPGIGRLSGWIGGFEATMEVRGWTLGASTTNKGG